MKDILSAAVPRASGDEPGIWLKLMRLVTLFPAPAGMNRTGYIRQLSVTICSPRQRG